MPPLRQTKTWVDRNGSAHVELSPTVTPQTPKRHMRIQSPMEISWSEAVREGGEHSARRCGDMAVSALAKPNPIIDDDPEGNPDVCMYTWIVECPGATAVLLWINGVFDHERIEESEMTRLEGSDLWILSLRMPSDWRASYTVNAWSGDGVAPWREAGDRMHIRKAAMSGGRPDSRAMGHIMDSSLVEGPDALPDCWVAASTSVKVVEETVAGEHFWFYEAPVKAPLLVLFDGQHWNNSMNLPAQVDAAIAIGLLPPVSLLMIDSVNTERRWDSVGVPGGQVDVLIDALLPHVRATYNVSARGEDTIVTGASFGGLASLWALALSDGEVGHAIAQSPSLWRFNVADALSAAEQWSSIHLQAGKYEGEMLRLSHQLAEDLSGDIREVRVRGVHGGHDWAWWRVHMLTELTRLLKTL
ncbi:alpha/beta hydrolase [Corynebacterium glutamicum]|uniref:alpha/beta hydrolase n=1 Tax=Corynebacterium glutamicum TaxID=1718 RepID=UPI00155E7AA1|nr:esterase family protein [Corynebacterium glutamicum]